MTTTAYNTAFPSQHVQLISVYTNLARNHKYGYPIIYKGIGLSCAMLSRLDLPHKTISTTRFTPDPHIRDADMINSEVTKPRT